MTLPLELHIPVDRRRERWLVLALAGLTDTLAIAAPGMSLSVLFKEISGDLSLSLVQVGVIWGIGALPTILTSLLSGAINDRFGPKRVMFWGTILVSLSGGLRGLADSFTGLAASVILTGLLAPLVIMSGIKMCGVWFPIRQLGLANGILSLGMALGFLLGSLLSATVLSPWLGGWRNVMFFYAGLGFLVGLPWLLTPAAPEASRQLGQKAVSISMRQAVKHVFRLDTIWRYGLALMGYNGCVQGALGYIPLYLRGSGWSPARADGALSMFHMTSMLFVLPLAQLSDRLGKRKNLLLVLGLMMASGIGWLSAARGWNVWAAVILAGMVRDGFMAVYMTSIVETEGIGPTYAGTATGFTLIFSSLGSLLAPPIGNRLAEISPGLPFVFWSALAILGMVSLASIKIRTFNTGAKGQTE